MKNMDIITNKKYFNKITGKHMGVDKEYKNITMKLVKDI